MDKANVIKMQSLAHTKKHIQKENKCKLTTITKLKRIATVHNRWMLPSFPTRNMTNKKTFIS